MTLKFAFVLASILAAAGVGIAQPQDDPALMPSGVTASAYAGHAFIFVKIEGDAARILRNAKGPALSRSIDCYRTDRDICQFSVDPSGAALAQKPPLGNPVRVTRGPVSIDEENGKTLLKINGAPADLLFTGMKKVPVARTTAWQARNGKHIYCTTLRNEPTGQFSHCLGRVTQGGFTRFSE